MLKFSACIVGGMSSLHVRRCTDCNLCNGIIGVVRLTPLGRLPASACSGHNGLASAEMCSELYNSPRGCLSSLLLSLSHECLSYSNTKRRCRCASVSHGRTCLRGFLPSGGAAIAAAACPPKRVIHRRLLLFAERCHQSERIPRRR